MTAQVSLSKPYLAGVADVRGMSMLAINWSDPAIVVAGAAGLGTALGIVVQKLLDAFALKVQHKLELERHFLTVRYEAARKASRLLMSSNREFSRIRKELERAISGKATAVETFSLTEAQLANFSAELVDAEADLYLLLDDESVKSLPLAKGDIFRAVAMAREAVNDLRAIDIKLQKLRGDAQAFHDDAQITAALGELARSRDELVVTTQELGRVIENFGVRIRNAVRMLHRTFAKYE